MFTLFLCGQISFSVPRSWVSYPLNAPSSSCLPRPLLQVQAEIKRKWRRWMLQRFLGADTKYQQPSIGSNGNNFSSQITVTTKCSPAVRRASECREHLSAIWTRLKRSRLAVRVVIVVYLRSVLLSLCVFVACRWGHVTSALFRAERRLCHNSHGSAAPV